VPGFAAAVPRAGADPAAEAPAELILAACLVGAVSVCASIALKSESSAANFAVAVPRADAEPAAKPVAAAFDETPLVATDATPMHQ